MWGWGLRELGPGAAEVLVFRWDALPAGAEQLVPDGAAERLGAPDLDRELLRLRAEMKLPGRAARAWSATTWRGGIGGATVYDEVIDPAALTDREREVLELALAGLSARSIAGRLSLGEATVRSHLSRIYAKLGVAGRGELQLAVLIETMRREGFELSIGRPRVLYKTDPETGQTLEPIEEVVIDVDEDYAGVVVDKLGQRRAELRDIRPTGGAKQRLVFHAPSRGLIGYHNEFMTDTRGTGVMNRVFQGYAPYKGPIAARRTGTLISTESGAAVAYALWYLEERGPLFVEPGERVYPGMIVGENSRGHDLDVNPTKTKHLTNIRAAGKDDAILLTPPIRMTLERAITYIGDDELVEVTPQSIRLRKRFLDSNERKREAKKQGAA